MKNLPKKLRVFFISVYVVTIISLYICIRYRYLAINETSFLNIAFFSVLVMMTETFTVPFKRMSFSTTFAIQLASFILFGPLITIIVTLIGFSFRVLKLNNSYKHILNTPLYGTLFNYSILTLSILYGNILYLVSGGELPISNITNFIPQIVLFSLFFFLTNTFIISMLYSISSNKNFFYCYLNNIRLSILNILAIAPFGIILAFIFKQFGYGGVILLFCPIILARYTFSLYIESKNQYVQTVDTLMRAMEARDRYTEGHSQRVAEIAVMIAKEMKYNELKLEQINIASLLHDVGKIGIDDNILNKPGKLTNEEYEIIKSHPEIGYNILKNIKNLEHILPIVRHHHERYDGNGYPDNKGAGDIGIDVFIVQLADSIDAMETDRPYRKAFTKEQVISEIKKYSGSQFHPKVVQAYLNIMEKQKKVV